MEQPIFILLEMSEHNSKILVDSNKIANAFWIDKESQTRIYLYDDSPNSVLNVKETPPQINELIHRARNEAVITNRDFDNHSIGISYSPKKMQDLLDTDKIKQAFRDYEKNKHNNPIITGRDKISHFNLLKKYMAHVISYESISYVDRIDNKFADIKFTEEETALLEEIENKARVYLDIQ